MVGKTKGEALSKEAAVLRALGKEIGELQELGFRDLRARYLAVFGEEARSKNLQFLRKKIAFRLQEQMEGGLSEAAQERITELAPQEVPTGSVRRPRRPALTPASLTSGAGGRDPRLPKAGTVVSREYKGFLHEVQVLKAGFLYRGRSYQSLSAIAKEITGTPWNGFLFFGLKAKGGTHGR